MRWAWTWGRALVAGAIASTTIAAWTGSAGASNDPYFVEQWALTRIHAPEAWSRTTGAGIRIGVVDTGIDLQHEDLTGKIAASVSCIGANDLQAACSGSAQDDQGHGTHVSGLAAAATGNGKGIASVAPDAQLVVVKALDKHGSGALNDVNAGIKWAVDHGARVINLSLESDGSALTVVPEQSQSLKEGIDYAWSHGVIPVIAAGNSTPSLFGQSGYDGINAVIVGATGHDDELAWYSSPLTSAKWGLVAPGGDVRDSAGNPSCAGSLAAGCVVSTGWFDGHVNEYANDEGTSMAAPQVAGVLALLLTQGLSPTAAISRMLSTADKISCGDACHGRVNAAAAVGASTAAPTTTAVTQAPVTSRPSAPPPTALAGASARPILAPVPTTVSPTTAAAPATTVTGTPVTSTAPPSLAVGRTSSHSPADHVPPMAIAIAVAALVGVGAEAFAVRRVL